MIKKKLPIELIEFAIHWWISSLFFPTFNGHDKKLEQAAAMLAPILKQNGLEIGFGHPPSDEQLSVFSDELRAILIALEGNWTQVSVHLYTDYGPEGILAEVAAKAGIPRQHFGWGYSMYLYYNGNVTFRVGDNDLIRHGQLIDGQIMIVDVTPAPGSVSAFRDQSDF